MSATKNARRKWRSWLADAKAGRLRIKPKKPQPASASKLHTYAKPRGYAE